MKIDHPFWKRHRLHIFLLFIYCLVVYFTGLWVRDLWYPHEPRFSEVAREMMVRGDYIFPYLNGREYLNKPPLFVWMICLSSWLWGEMTAMVVRLPSAIFGTLGVIFTYLLGREIFNGKIAFLGSLVLASNIRYLWQARHVRIDMVFSVLILGAVLFFIYYRRRGNSKWLIPGYILLGLAVLTKGPLAVILMAFALWCYGLFPRTEEEASASWMGGLWKGGWRQVKDLFSYFPRWGWLGLALFVAISSSWYTMFIYAGGIDYAYHHFVHQMITRFTSGTGGHVKPVWFYFEQFSISFMPWTLFLPGVFLLLWKQLKSDRDDVPHKELFWLVTWFGLGFAFFSASKSKQSIYILPLFPAAALVVGYYLTELSENYGSDLSLYSFWAFVMVGGALMVLGGLAAPVVLYFILPHLFFTSLWMGAVLIAAGGGMLWMVRKGTVPQATMWLSGVVGAGFLAATFALMPIIDQHKSSKPMARLIESVVGDKPCYLFGSARPDFAFFNRRVYYFYPAHDWGKEDMVERIKEHQKKGEVVYLIVEKKDLSHLPPYGSKHFQIEIEGKIGDDPWVVMKSDFPSR